MEEFIHAPKWCDDILWMVKEEYYYLASDNKNRPYHMKMDFFSFCPICGTPRPKPQAVGKDKKQCTNVCSEIKCREIGHSCILESGHSGKHKHSCEEHAEWVNEFWCSKHQVTHKNGGYASCKPKKDEPKSNCCSSPFKRVANTSGIGSTNYYVCTKCGKACDELIPKDEPRVPEPSEWIYKRAEEIRKRGGFDGVMWFPMSKDRALMTAIIDYLCEVKKP